MFILNTAHAFSSTFASTLMVGGFCYSTVYLRSWGRHLFLIKTISSCISFLCLPPILGETYCFCTFCQSVSLSVTKSCAHFSDETADRRDLKLCTMLYYHLQMCISSGEEDPIIFLWVKVDPRGVGCEISCAHFFSDVADHRDLKLCTMLHYH